MADTEPQTTEEGVAVTPTETHEEEEVVRVDEEPEKTEGESAEETKEDTGRDSTETENDENVEDRGDKGEAPTQVEDASSPTSQDVEEPKEAVDEDNNDSGESDVGEAAKAPEEEVHEENQPTEEPKADEANPHEEPAEKTEHEEVNSANEPVTQSEEQSGHEEVKSEPEITTPVEQEKEEKEEKEEVSEAPSTPEEEATTEKPVEEKAVEEKPAEEKPAEEKQEKEEKEEQEQESTPGESKSSPSVITHEEEDGENEAKNEDKEKGAEPEKGAEKEKQAPKKKAEKPPKATLEILSRLELLPFEVSTDGGEHEEYPVTNLLINDPAKVYASKEQRNVNLSFKYTGPSAEGFVVTHIVVRSPAGSAFSAPLKDGLIFVSQEKMSEGVLLTYDNFTRNDYTKLLRDEELKNKGEEKRVDETIPVAFFDMAYSNEQVIKLPKWRRGKYITIKLLNPGGDQANIDTEFVAAVGFDAAKAPPEGTVYDIGNQTLVDMELITEAPKFTNITGKEHIPIFQNCLRNGSALFLIYVDEVDPAKAEEIKAAAQNVAKTIVVDDDLSMFLTGEESAELKMFAVQSRPALNLPQEQKPLVTIYADGTKYVMPEGAEINESSLLEFLEGYRKGTLKTWLRSAPRPENDADPRRPGLTVLTANSFEEIVFNAEADVFVHYFVEPEPIYYTLSRVLSDQTHIIVANYDLEDNDVAKEHLEDAEPPVLKLYRKGDKTNPITYNGPVQGDALLKFLHDHCDEPKFDLSAKMREFEMLHPILLAEAKRHYAEARDEIFNELRKDPQFNQIRMLLHQRPELAGPMIEEWVRSDPFMGRLIMAYGEEFIALLQEPLQQRGGVPPNIRRTEDGRVQISVTPEQKRGLDELMQEFSQEEVVEAFIECDQDIEATRRLLKDGIAPSHAGHSHSHGHGGHSHSHGGVPGSRFSAVDDDDDEQGARPSSGRGPLARTPITPRPHPSKKKKKKVNWGPTVVGAGLLLALGAGVAYYFYSNKK